MTTADELGFEHGFGPLHDAVEGCCHPWDCRMLDAALDRSDVPAGAVELFSGGP
jgi:hypothetical protein